MRNLAIIAGIFAASLFGVLAAFQIEHFTSPKEHQILSTDRDFPYAKPVSFGNLPAGPADFRSAAKKIMPSVVSVDQRVARRDFWTDQVQVATAGTGSGVIISQDGLILTNNHVISGADEIRVRTVNDKTYQAKLVGADPKADLALIRINAPDLVPATLGDSDQLEVGQWVLAVGNPLGYSNTVSAGVVSSLKRTLPTENNGLLLDAIQTDAAINMGNSGGALANDQGEVIGINSAIASLDGGSIGVGFAIPINRAKKVVHDLLQYGHVKYGDPGFTIYQRLIQDWDVQDALRNSTSAEPPKSGLVIHAVTPNGPAASAGVHTMDVVESINGIPMNNPNAFTKFFADKKPGDRVSMKIWDAGQTRNIALSLVDAGGDFNTP